MKISNLVIIGSLLVFSFSNVNGQEVTACDLEAAHPSDPNHVGVGKSSDDVDTFAAIVACRESVKTSPKTARFHYQLGRALVYQGELEQGKAHVKHAADMGYMQAQFVLGLLTKTDDVCGAEKRIKAAADQGLKSARITYLSDFLGGAYSECRLSATRAEMSAYLEGAESQMSNYYERLLHGGLIREFAEN